jgi:glycosyltransferase involved in cell wall biosynthesis
MVMIEALAAGTPVIATRRGSAPEIIDDGVTGCLSGGIRELAAALNMAGRLDRRACRRAAETRFSRQRMVSEHLQLYKDAFTGSPVPAPTHPFAASKKGSASLGQESSFLMNGGR